MSFGKRLVFLGVLVGAGYGALQAWESPYFALWQIHKGLEARDPGLVERYVDLEAFVKATADVSGALAGQALGVDGADLGSQLLGAVVGLVAKGVGEAASVEGAMELRRSIQRGQVRAGLGPFTIHEDFHAFGGSEQSGANLLVELHGLCRGGPASVRAVFEGRAGSTFGHPKKWVLVGVDAESVKQLIKQCRAGPGRG